MLNSRHLFGREVVGEDKQSAGTDVDVCIRVNQVDAVDSRRGALVELTGDELNSQISYSVQREGVHNRIGYDFTKNTVSALLQQFGSKTEQVVHTEVAQAGESQPKILVQLVPEALRLYAKPFFFLDKKTIIHIK